MSKGLVFGLLFLSTIECVSASAKRGAFSHFSTSGMKHRSPLFKEYSDYFNFSTPISENSKVDPKQEILPNGKVFVPGMLTIFEVNHIRFNLSSSRQIHQPIENIYDFDMAPFYKTDLLTIVHEYAEHFQQNMNKSDETEISKLIRLNPEPLTQSAEELLVVHDFKHGEAQDFVAAVKNTFGERVNMGTLLAIFEEMRQCDNPTDTKIRDFTSHGPWRWTVNNGKFLNVMDFVAYSCDGKGMYSVVAYRNSVSGHFIHGDPTVAQRLEAWNYSRQLLYKAFATATDI